MLGLLGIGGGGGVLFGWGCGEAVAGVEEAGVVVEPGGGGELGPADGVGEVLAGGDVADVPADPVGAGFGEGVGGEGAVVGEGEAGQGDGAVGGEGVGVEEDVGGAREAVLPEDDGLVLEAGVVAVEVAGAVAGGRGEALEVHELGEAAGEGVAGGFGVDVLAGEGVLGGDPGGELGAVEVFHPAVGVGDGGAEVVVDVRGAAGGGVGEGGCGHGEWFLDCLRGGAGLSEAGK